MDQIEKPEVSEVEVDISEKPIQKEAPKQEAIVRTPAEELGLSPAEIKKMHSRMEYQARQFEVSQKKMDTIAAQVAQLVDNISRPAKKPEDMDELDQLAEKDWKAAVRKLGREEAEAILKEERAKQANEQRKLSAYDRLEKSKQYVLSKHPELVDENSEKSRVYLEVLNDHQNFLENEEGPRLAMQEMEDRLRGKNGQQKQEPRTQRVAAIPQGRSPGKDDKVTLTSDQREYCDANNISYERYAKTLKSLETQGSVEA